MKTFRLIGMALVAILVCAACSKDDVTVNQEQKCFTVGLGVTGEYLEISDTPLGTRATTTADTYGINVYRIKDNGGTEFYAYGCFTSLEDVKIKLWEGQKYKFEVRIYVDDQIVEHNYNGGEEGGPDGGFDIPDPLSLENSVTYIRSTAFSRDIENEFVYGGLPITNPSGYKYDYFYGELTEYTPSENSTVEIATKRTVYGAHYIVENLTEGRLHVAVSKGIADLYTVSLTDDNPENNGIYRFCNTWAAWEGNADGSNYTSTKLLTLKWIKDDGRVLALGEYSVTFKRNVKTTIKIKVKDKSDITNGIIITREESAMTDDSNEYQIEVEDGTITEVPVTNQQ